MIDALVRSAFDVIGVVSAVAAAHELSLTQLRLMAILRDHEPTMSELADYLGLDRSSVTGLVDRAAQRGLLTRVPHGEDRRSVRVALTVDGRVIAARGEAEIAGALAPRLTVVPTADRRHLADLLDSTLQPPPR